MNDVPVTINGNEMIVHMSQAYNNNLGYVVVYEYDVILKSNKWGILGWDKEKYYLQ